MVHYFAKAPSCDLFSMSLTFNTLTHAQNICAESISMETYKRECCIRGYHVYKDMWEVAIGKNLNVCARRATLSIGTQYIAVLKDDTIVGHLLKTSARIYSLFLRRGVVIWCRVAGSRKYSDLPQGIKFSQDKISPPQVLDKNRRKFSRCENIALYGTHLQVTCPSKLYPPYILVKVAVATQLRTKGPL